MQTWEKGVLYAEHGWSVSIIHFLHDLLFGHVRTAIFDTNPSFQVVEVATVQLKEFNQQHAHILIGVSGIDTRVKLQSERRNLKFCKWFLNITRRLCFYCNRNLSYPATDMSRYLQEADDHEDQTVRADSSGEDFVQIPLEQKLLQHKDQVRQHWVHLKEGGVEWGWTEPRHKG